MAMHFKWAMLCASLFKCNCSLSANTSFQFQGHRSSFLFLHPSFFPKNSELSRASSAQSYIHLQETEPWFKCSYFLHWHIQFLEWHANQSSALLGNLFAFLKTKLDIPHCIPSQPFLPRPTIPYKCREGRIFHISSLDRSLKHCQCFVKN